MLSKINKVTFAKTPTGINTRLSLPERWLNFIGVDNEHRYVKITIKNNKIIIEKASGKDDN